METKANVGQVIELTGDTFFDAFIKNDENINDYQYLLLSTDIQTTGEFTNVISFPALIPDGYLIEYYLSDEKKQFKHEYNNYLMKDEIRAFITVMMKSVVYNGFKLVLMCSEEENEYGYIKMIRKFIEKEYGFPTYNYKKYVKARDNGELKEIKDLEGIKQQIEKEVKRIEKLHINVGGGQEDKMEKASKALDKMSKKELKQFCKKKGYKKKKYQDLDKDGLKEFIIKKIKKEAK